MTVEDNLQRGIERFEIDCLKHALIHHTLWQHDPEAFNEFIATILRNDRLLDGFVYFCTPIAKQDPAYHTGFWADGFWPFKRALERLNTVIAYQPYIDVLQWKYRPQLIGYAKYRQVGAGEDFAKHVRESTPIVGRLEDASYFAVHLHPIAHDAVYTVRVNSGKAIRNIHRFGVSSQDERNRYQTAVSRTILSDCTDYDKVFPDESANEYILTLHKPALSENIEEACSNWKYPQKRSEANGEAPPVPIFFHWAPRFGPLTWQKIKNISDMDWRFRTEDPRNEWYGGDVEFSDLPAAYWKTFFCRCECAQLVHSAFFSVVKSLKHLKHPEAAISYVNTYFRKRLGQELERYWKRQQRLSKQVKHTSNRKTEDKADFDEALKYLLREYKNRCLIYVANNYDQPTKETAKHLNRSSSLVSKYKKRIREDMERLNRGELQIDVRSSHDAQWWNRYVRETYFWSRRQAELKRKRKKG